MSLLIEEAFEVTIEETIEEPRPSPRRWRLAWPEVAVILWAVVTRFAGIGTWSFSGDELFTHHDSMQFEWTAPLDAPWAVRHYPLGYWSTRLAYDLFGPGEWAARFFPALFGTLTIVLLLFGARPLLGRNGARFAALLLLTSPWHLFYSQCARFYALTTLLGTAGLIGMAIGLEQARRWPLWCGLGALLVGVLAHPSAALVLVAIGAAMSLGMIARRQRPPGFSRRCLGPPALLLAVIAIFAAPDLWRLLTMRHTASLTEIVYEAGHLAMALPFNIGPHLGLLAVAGAILLFTARRGSDAPPSSRRLAILLGSVALLPSLGLIVLAALEFSVGQRYALASLPAWCCLGAVGLDALHHALRRQRALRWLAIGLIVAAPAPSWVSHYLDGNRHDFRAAAQYLAERIAPGDLVLADSHGYLTHYAGVEAEELPMPVEEMERRLAQSRQLWCVVATGRRGFNSDPNGTTLDFVRRHGILERAIVVPRLDYYRNEIRIYRCEPVRR